MAFKSTYTCILLGSSTRTVMLSLRQSITLILSRNAARSLRSCASKKIDMRLKHRALFHCEGLGTVFEEFARDQQSIKTRCMGENSLV